MKKMMSRREFLEAGAAGMTGAVVTPTLMAAPLPLERYGPAAATRATRYAAGISLNTRPEWEQSGAANFIRAMDEASEVGFRMISISRGVIGRWIDANDPQGLRDELQRRGLGLITVWGGGNFTDPAQRASMIERNLEICRFIKQLGSGFLMATVGGEQPRGQAQQTPQVYREMARGMNELGERITDLGMRFATHQHLNSALETPQDVEAIMESTDPRHVWMTLDTGHITNAGMDPVQLTRDYTSRIVEYHLKDTVAEARGGSRKPMGRMIVEPERPTYESEYPGILVEDLPASVRYRDRVHFELGHGGVDFVGIMRVLDEANWSGYMTVELDSSETTARGSAQVNKEYMERIMKLDVETPNQRPLWNA